MGDSNNCRDWEREYVKNKFTMAERAVAAVLVAMGLTLLILGGFTNGYAQSVLAEGGTGVILFCALGLAAPRRLPPWSVLALAVVGSGVLFCGTRVPDSFGYLQSIAADIGIAILLFIVLDRIVADLAIQPLEYLLIALRLSSVFTARNLRDDYRPSTGVFRYYYPAVVVTDPATGRIVYVRDAEFVDIPRPGEAGTGVYRLRRNARSDRLESVMQA